MSDMISKQAVVKWLDQQIGIFKVTKEEEIEQILVLLKRHINDGLFDSSNQGEAARLRKAVLDLDDIFGSPILSPKEMIKASARVVREALSSHTEDKENEREKFALSLDRRKLHQLVQRHDGNPTLKEMLCAEADGRYLSEDTGIQKVLELWRNYRNSGRFISARAVLETTRALGITIPVITDGGETD